MTPQPLARRPDGWPLCPVCGEDELADLGYVHYGLTHGVHVSELRARPDARLFCYRCGTYTVENGASVS